MAGECEVFTAGEYGSVWVNLETHRVVRGDFGKPGQRDQQSFSYSYDATGPKDVYALGVPRDAKVIDGRPGEEAMKLVEAWDARINGSIDDGVMIVTRVVKSFVGGPNEKMLDGLDVFARGRRPLAAPTFQRRRRRRAG